MGYRYEDLSCVLRQAELPYGIVIPLPAQLNKILGLQDYHR
jgi:hypothetical protein